MSVITISRQLGSQGSEVAAAVGARLGYRVASREVIEEAARRAGAPEAALAAIDELGLLGLCPSTRVCHAYQRAIQQVMRELAAQGNVVIVGRAGQAILRGQPAALHIRIVAPVSVRIERIARTSHISLRAAKAQVQASDTFRRDYLKRFYRVDWDDSALYDLVVNTALFSPVQAAELIAAAISHRHVEDLALESVTVQPS